MSDKTLDDLQAWFANRDRLAFGRAYEALQREAQPIVQRLEPWHARESLRERVQEIVNSLLFPPPNRRPPGRPTQLLPAGQLRADEAARSYRARTIYRFLVDQHRARLRQQELDLAAADPVTAASILETRRRRRAHHWPTVTAQPRIQAGAAATTQASGLSVSEARAFDRIAVRRSLARLSNIRYRAIVSIELGLDLTPILPELAGRLERDEGVLARELDALAPGDNEALIRIFYPLPEPIAKASENFGRARRRAFGELRMVLGRELGQ